MGPSLARVGIEFNQEGNSSVTLTQEDFTTNAKTIPTPPELWPTRQKTLSAEEIQPCQRKLGALCCLATFSRPDICARLARIASRVNSFQRSDFYQINELVRTVRGWQGAAILTHASSSHPNEWKEEAVDGEMEARGESVGWSDAAHGGQVAGGKCRLGSVIGIVSTSLTGPRHVLQGTSKFTRKLDKSSLEVTYILAAKWWPTQRGCGIFVATSPGMIGLGGCSSPFTHL